MKFKDKIVVVTGSSRGIGRSIAIAFAEEGACVVVNYVNDKVAANEVVSKIEAMGTTAIAVHADISREDDVQRLMSETVTKFGGIDILVNNAGIVYDVPLLEKTYEQWEHVLRTNLIGTFLCCKYAVPHMKDRHNVSILTISSTNGIDCLSPESADYDASKAGVISLTKNLARELAPSIRVNCIAPGWVTTDINKNLPEEYIQEEAEKIAMKRFGRPEEIAKAALFLSSEDASFITGTTLVIDGGYH